MSTNHPPADACLSDAELLGLLDPDTDEAAGRAASVHLEMCADCLDRLHNMAGAGVVLPPAHSKTGIESVVLRTLMERLQDSAPGGDDSDDAAWMDGVLFPPVTPGTLGSFAGYDVLERLAGGGMGIVCKAFDRSLNRVVAIKILSPVLAVSAAARARFVREARAAAAIAHEHVVAIHAVGEERGLPFLVMQFVKGRSLQARLDDVPMTLPEILRIGAQTASGLAAAHAQGIVHRDIKPGNILLENSVERVQLTDFGLARAVDEPVVTRPGTLAGTPEYMSPEQARGEPTDARSDLFSLGCVLHAMAAGQSPFAGPSLHAVLKRVCEETPPPVHGINPALPAWFSSIVQRLLAKAPVDRLQSAAETAQLLADCLAKVQSHQTPVFPAPRSRRRVLIAAGAIAGLAALTLALWPARPPSVSPGMVFTLFKQGGTQATGFANLTAAVVAAQSNDVIEINANGVIRCDPLALGDKALTLRAARGARPVLVNRAGTGAIISSAAPLVLEGLELRAFDSDSDVIPANLPATLTKGSSNHPQQHGQATALVHARGSSIRINRCRLVGSLQGSVTNPLLMENVSDAVILSSGFYQMTGSAIRCRFGSRNESSASEPVLTMTNCVALARVLITVEFRDAMEQRIELDRNTVISAVLMDAFGQSRIRARGTGNVFNIQRLKPVQTGPGRFNADYSWRGENNVYRDPDGTRFMVPPAPADKAELTDRLARSEPKSWVIDFNILRDFRYRSGNSRPVRPADFRLQVDAASLPAGLTEAKLREIGARLEEVESGTPGE